MFWNKKKNDFVEIKKKGAVIVLVKKCCLEYSYFNASNKRYKVILRAYDSFINISVDSEQEAFEIMKDIKQQISE